MKVQLVRALLWCLGALPFRVMEGVGAGIGLLLWLVPNRSRRNTQDNVARCYPGRDAAWRRAFTRASLVATGRTAAESFWLLSRDREQVLPLVHAVRGAEHIDEARAAGRGIICATPHLGAWELAAAWVSTRTPLTVLFRPPRQAALAEILRRGRERLGGRPVPTDGSGVRALHRALRAGEAIGILPDQQPRDGQGVYAPFMGQPALTMTLLSRIAARTGAAVLFTVMVRNPDARGFTLHVWPADAAIADPDPVVAATRVNREVERAIALAPEQYMWSYQRFRRRGGAAPAGQGAP
ncbi:MAG: lipid A biosynthesis acyltransferase [Halofilum sp. (in: g-proteobacteria)]|nr:lipid A biosynthesis acyltransferase [Halofilum sp. (in: g-proteobacteria)]